MKSLPITVVLLLTTTLLLLVFTGWSLPNENEFHPSKAEQLVNITLAKAAQTIQKKYKIQPSGEGVSMPGGPIRKLALCFDTKDQFSKEKLRELLIKCAQELLSQINTNEEIQIFLIKTPFAIDNVQIIIYNHDKYGRELFDPEISTAEISEGILTYRTVDSEDDFKFKNQFEESYKDALKAMETSPS